MSTLPVELFRYTLEQVPFAKRDLCSLARVSQYLQPEAERLLYHHIEVENYLDIVKACKAICRTERYGPLIRRFDIRFDIVGPWYHGVTTLHTHWIYVRTFIKLLAATLQRMVSLEILHIFLPEDLAYLESSCLGFFERCTFRLTTLGSRFSIDRHLLSFLAQQPDIVCLELYNRPLGPGINVLPFNLLPRLTTLGTYFYNDGLHFVSGHSITNLAIGFVRIENIRLFLRSFTSIKVLDMTIRADWDQVLGVIGEAIPALEVLFLPFATIEADSMSPTISLLSQFPKLAEVEWNKRFGWDSTPTGMDEMVAYFDIEVIPHLSIKCPLLRSVRYAQWETSERLEKQLSWERAVRMVTLSRFRKSEKAASFV